MPVILRPEDYDHWLDPAITAHGQVRALLAPLDATWMKKYPVSTRVGNPAFDDPECAREAPLVQSSAPTLFE